MRTLVLAALAAIAVVLALTVHAPERRTGQAAVSGTRLVRVPAHAVQRIDLTLDGRHAVFARAGSGWTANGVALDERGNGATRDLLVSLTGLRAVDQFRGEPQASFGLTPPRGTIVLATPRREVRLWLGAFTATTATVYARRERDHRVFQVGTYLLSQLDRVLDLAH